MIYSVGLNQFIVPVGLYNGGFLGIAQLIRHFMESWFGISFGNTNIAGILYLFAFSNKLLPDSRTDTVSEDGEDENPGNFHRVEAVLGARFPGINKTLGEFNFTRHYGAIVKEVKSGGQRFTRNLDTVVLHEGDTLVLWADDSFILHGVSLVSS